MGKKTIQRIISGKFLDISLTSDKYQLVNIRIFNLIGDSKISVWEEIYSGVNALTIDISGLIRGSYRLVVNYPDCRVNEESFTIC